MTAGHGGHSSAVKRALKNTWGMVPVPEELENLSEEDVKHMKKRQRMYILLYFLICLPSLVFLFLWFF